MKTKPYLKRTTITAVAAIIILLITSCGGTTTPAPATPPPAKTPTVAELMNKTWTVSSVKEDAAIMYTSGNALSLRMGYIDFKLDLSSLSAAKLTAVDKVTFTGTWSISGDGKTLTLLNLNPEPTGTSGTIAYVIESLTATSVKLIRNTLNRKTGATKTEYEMTNK